MGCEVRIILGFNPDSFLKDIDSPIHVVNVIRAFGSHSESTAEIRHPFIGNPDRGCVQETPLKAETGSINVG